MITLELKGADELAAVLDDTAKQLPQDLAIVCNATAKKVRTHMSRQIREEITAKAGEVKKTLKQSKRANRGSLGAAVTLSETQRLSLKAFGAKQTSTGVSYRISKKGGRKRVLGGFRGPRPGVVAPRLGGHAFKRTTRKRSPIVKLHGISPWGVYTKRHMERETLDVGQRELDKQVQRRIRFRLLKKAGQIR